MVIKAGRQSFGFSTGGPIDSYHFKKSSETCLSLASRSTALLSGKIKHFHVLLKVNLAVGFPPIPASYLEGVLRKHSMSA